MVANLLSSARNARSETSAFGVACTGAPEAIRASASSPLIRLRCNMAAVWHDRLNDDNAEKSRPEARSPLDFAPAAMAGS